MKSSSAAPGLDQLPRLASGESFRFACHPRVPCFNACCRDLDLLLNPYDVLRLRRRLGMSSVELFRRYLDAGEEPDTGFPMVGLRMTEAPGRPCPFVRSAGCAVYADRPAACRIYPLGRGIAIDASGQAVEHWCLVREPHCRGFEEASRWTAETWVRDQGVAEHAALDDRYLRLALRARRDGRRLDETQQRQVGVAMYQLDRFADALREGDLLERAGVSCDERAAILADEVQRLRFALDWLARELFGPP